MNDNIAGTHEESLVKRLERNVSLLQERIRLLEEENARLEDMLGDHGVTVHPRSRIALELPPPIRDPSAAVLDAAGLMNDEERRLFDELCPRDKALLLLRSGSRTDVGRWFRKGTVWVCAAREEIILLAAGPRPFVQKTPFSFLRESLYNHVTGKVVLVPAPGLAINSFKLPPLEGYQALAQIYAKNNEEKAQ